MSKAEAAAIFSVSNSPLWIVSYTALNTSNLKCKVHNSVLQSLPSEETLSHPLECNVCLVVLGKGRGLQKHKGQLHNVVTTQLNHGGHVVLQSTGKHDGLQFLKAWKEFHPVSGRTDLFTNFDIECDHMFYELGDHADDLIQAASAVRRKVIPIEQHYDDCGNDVSALDLPELSVYVKCFESEDEPSSDEEEFTSSFYSSHLWGSDVESRAESLPNISQIYITINSWPKGSSTDFVEIFGGAAGMSKVAIRTGGPQL